MSRVITPFQRRNPLPSPPPDIAEEVELYARESGRTATLHFVPFGGWFARFSLRCNDRRLIAFQEGRAGAPPTEDVWFHVPNPKADVRGEQAYIALDIVQMGRSGVRTFLERGNTWSGRGEHASLPDALKASEQYNADAKVRRRAEQKEANRMEQRERRRSRFKIPFLRAGIELGRGTNQTQETP